VTVEEFISKWSGLAGGAERANFSPFIYDLVRVLGLPEPEPAEGGKLGAYQFEGPIPKASFRNPQNKGSADLYKRGCFIMEAKQSYMPPRDDRQAELIGEGDELIPLTPAGARYDKYMTTARAQVENYAKNLPASEPVAPFLIVCDIGRAFEVYHDSAGNGRGYTFFPDKQSYRIPLPKLRDPDIAARLKAIWTEPRSIDPRFQAADVTRAVAMSLAQVSKDLEEGTRIRSKLTSEREKAEEIEESALFLMRILFCMFAEDVGLLPKNKFREFLRRAEGNDQLFANGLADLWHKMGAANVSPRFAYAFEQEVKYFNGGLFAETARTFQLSSIDIHHLYEAARQNWRKVEPAIFGTLLEQALTPEERAKLGAHYTPRPYVETLVRATIMDVLEPEWAKVEEEIAALNEAPSPFAGKGRGAAAPKGEGLAFATAFHDRLSTIRVLDPACGTGNFLYVAMELIQALEARVIETIQTLGGHAEPKVGPHQFHGLEKNPRAAKIAELVLWIGWLRNRLHDDPDSVPQPVLAESANINFGKHGGYDAVLKMNALGQPDLETPTIPDWPQAEFIVGNPPFIGGKDLRERLGSDYAEALWKANARVPKSADFVMQWWDRAAHTLVAKDSPLIRFGLVTTNSITQEFSRRVIANYLSSPLVGEDQGGGAAASAAEETPESGDSQVGDSPSRRPRRAPTLPSPQGGALSLAMAIPDHPWTKATKDAAAVRIAMTVAERGEHYGELREVTKEIGVSTDEPKIELARTEGRINADLTAGVDVNSVVPLNSNEGIASPGVKLHGDGFIVSRVTAKELGLGFVPGLEAYVRPYRNGRDLLAKSRDVLVIDLFGLTEPEVRQRFPDIYQHLLSHVWDYKEWNNAKKEWAVKGRKYNNRESYVKQWWIFGEPRRELRPALEGLGRYIATVETSKHRIFQFLEAAILPDNMIITIASEEAFHLGVLQSNIHLEWTLRTGGWLGYGNDNRYNKSKVFDPFPFPEATPELRSRIAELAEELDATRKAALVETDKLTMTELYNLREKLSSGEAMDEKEQRRATKARAAIVNRLHEQLDQAVADAYGWGEEWRAGTIGPAETVARLVALNHERTAEEKAGKVRWLRPDYQIPRFAPKETQ
jgi:hypothetical protein